MKRHSTHSHAKAKFTVSMSGSKGVAKISSGASVPAAYAAECRNIDRVTSRAMRVTTRRGR